MLSLRDLSAAEGFILTARAKRPADARLQEDPDSKGPLIPLGSCPQFKDTSALDCAERGLLFSQGWIMAKLPAPGRLWSEVSQFSGLMPVFLLQCTGNLTPLKGPGQSSSSLTFAFFTDPFSLNWLITLGTKPFAFRVFHRAAWREEKDPWTEVRTLSGNRNG